MNMSSGNISGLAFLATLAAIGSAIFWMVVGWRAMRAHERMANATEQVARKLGEPTA